MPHRTSIESYLTAIGKYISPLEPLISLIAALIVFASALIGLSAVRSWVNEKRRNASRIMIAVLEAQRAIRKVRNTFHGYAELQAAKSSLEVTKDDNPAVLGKIVLNRMESEMKCIDELESCAITSSIVFGSKVEKEIDGIIKVISNISTNAKILIKTSYESKNATKVFEVLKDSNTDDKISKAVEGHVEAIRRNIRRYLPS